MLLWHVLCIIDISFVLVLSVPMYCKCITYSSCFVFCSLWCSARHGHITNVADWQPVLAAISQREGKKHLSQPRDSQESQSSVIFCINITGTSHAQKQTNMWRILFTGMNLKQTLFQHSSKKQRESKTKSVSSGL